MILIQCEVQKKACFVTVLLQARVGTARHRRCLFVRSVSAKAGFGKAAYTVDWSGMLPPLQAWSPVPREARGNRFRADTV